MLYTVMKVSESIGISKQNIYKKLKLKELQNHITKRQGIAYIDEIGFNLIKDSLNLNDYNSKNFEKEEAQVGTEETEKSQDLDVDDDIININIDIVNTLTEQLKEKNIQLNELNERLKQEQELNKSNQVLQEIKRLEERFQDLDDKLLTIKDQVNECKEPQKGLFKRLFNT